MEVGEWVIRYLDNYVLCIEKWWAGGESIPLFDASFAARHIGSIFIKAAKSAANKGMSSRQAEPEKINRLVLQSLNNTYFRYLYV